MSRLVRTAAGRGGNPNHGADGKFSAAAESASKEARAIGRTDAPYHDKVQAHKHATELHLAAADHLKQYADSTMKPIPGKTDAYTMPQEGAQARLQADYHLHKAKAHNAATIKLAKQGLAEARAKLEKL